VSWKFDLLMPPPERALTEGPVWDGESLYFTHILASRILRYDPDSGSVTTWRDGTKATNGLAFDANGRLFGCCAGGRALVRFDSDNRMTTIVDALDGRRLNMPNDLAIDRRGRIWFTNPWSESIATDGKPELDHMSVLRADPQSDGAYSVTRVTFDTTKPNGILVSQDQRTLYVAESGFARGVPRELRAYPILDDGSLGPYATLFTWGEDAAGVHRGIDGMCLDAEGNIVATAGWEVSGAGPMIYVISPTGRPLAAHPVPARRPTNCCFGGAGMSTLFVTTTDGHLFRAQTDRVGWAMFP